MNPASYSPTINKTWEYLFTVNKNNPVKLPLEDLKDVHQECCLRLTGRSYPDLLVKKLLGTVYRRTVNKLSKFDRLEERGEIIDAEEENESVNLEKERRARVGRLQLTKLQKKIIELLITGYSYEEVRKKLKLSAEQLRYNTKRIKAANQVDAARQVNSNV